MIATSGWWPAFRNGFDITPEEAEPVGRGRQALRIAAIMVGGERVDFRQVLSIRTLDESASGHVTARAAVRRRRAPHSEARRHRVHGAPGPREGRCPWLMRNWWRVDGRDPRRSIPSDRRTDRSPTVGEDMAITAAAMITARRNRRHLGTRRNPAHRADLVVVALP